MKIIVIAITLLLGACSGAQVNHYTKHIQTGSILPDDTTLYLNINNRSEDIPFLGYVNYDKLSAGNGANVMYPGDTAGLFIVAVLAHAATVESVKDKKKSDLQLEANKYLVGYEDVLGMIDRESLMELSLTSLNQESNTVNFDTYGEELSGEAYVLDSRPVYFMLDDESGFILKNILSVYPEGNPKNILYQNMVEVVSDTYFGEASKEYWLEDKGKRFVDTNSEMFLRSLSIMMKDFQGEYSADAQEKTFRYTINGIKSYERGKLLSTNCGYVVMKTLRGWLKALPEPIDSEECADSTVDEVTFVR